MMLPQRAQGAGHGMGSELVVVPPQMKQIHA
jgi:hypothetical protein